MHEVKTRVESKLESRNRSTPQAEAETDERKCLLCGRLGDIEEESAGRLLYYRSGK